MLKLNRRKHYRKMVKGAHIKGTTLPLQYVFDSVSKNGHNLNAFNLALLGKWYCVKKKVNSVGVESGEKKLWYKMLFIKYIWWCDESESE
jgi:hypothetical protein